MQSGSGFRPQRAKEDASRAASLVKALNPASGWAATGGWWNGRWPGSHRFRRLTIRYERRADIYEAFVHLGCILVCWNFIHRKGFC
jgi:hypothetical protein